MYSKNLVETYIGKRLSYDRAPQEMIIYLAFYIQFKLPFFDVISKQPEVLF